MRALFITGLLLALLGATTLHSADSTDEDLLSSRGLSRVGATYVLEEDAHLADGLKHMYAAKNKLEENGRKRAAIEADITRANDLMAQLNTKARELNDQLASMNKHNTRYNGVATQINSNNANIRDGEKYLADCQRQLKGLVDPSDDYIAAVLDLSAKMEAAAKKYDELASDKDISDAISKLNEHAPPKVKLGPSAQFTQQLVAVRRARDAINSSVIQCDVSDGTARVEVTFNGSVKQQMVVDSGASLVTITNELASRLGMKPGKNDPVVEAKIANGNIVSMHVMRVDSIRLGQFTVEKVECMVLPPKSPGADCLLGGSFLKNFVYRMDLASGQLHMSEIVKSAGATTKSTTAPATPTTRRVVKFEIPSEDCRIICVADARALAIGHSGVQRGRHVVTAKVDENRADEIWQFKTTTDGSVQLVNKKSGLMPGPDGGSTSAGASILQRDTAGKDDEQWQIEPVTGTKSSGTVFKIINKKSGLCLTAIKQSGPGDPPVIQAAWEQSDFQIWRFGQ